MKPRLFLAAFMTLSLSACAAAGVALVNSPLAIDKSSYSRQEFTYGSDPLQKLDVYVPKAKTSMPRDVIVFIHGGRWTEGKKADYQFVAARLVQKGFIVVIPDFRKYPHVRFPVFVEDAAKAVAWTHANISRFGGKPNGLHLAGHSSGAHVAALLTADERYLAAEKLNTHTIIANFVGLAGPYAFTPDEPDLMDMFGPPENYPSMQATSFINGKEPPMLLMYGEQDTLVKALNHEKLAERIKQAGGQVAVKLYPDLDHISIMSTFSPLGPKSSVVDDMVAFFRTNN